MGNKLSHKTFMETYKFVSYNELVEAKVYRYKDKIPTCLNFTLGYGKDKISVLEKYIAADGSLFDILKHLHFIASNECLNKIGPRMKFGLRKDDYVEIFDND